MIYEVNYVFKERTGGAYNGRPVGVPARTLAPASNSVRFLIKELLKVEMASLAWHPAKL